MKASHTANSRLSMQGRVPRGMDPGRMNQLGHDFSVFQCPHLWQTVCNEEEGLLARPSLKSFGSSRPGLESWL